jgi:hypothetical protein
MLNSLLRAPSVPAVVSFIRLTLKRPALDAVS